MQHVRTDGYCTITGWGGGVDGVRARAQGVRAMGDSSAEQQAAEDRRRREELLEKVREANRLSTGRPCPPPGAAMGNDDEDEG
ncbi:MULTISPECIES: hypothetical protein [Streptomyces]|uniref:hypothetical protein n=1 Tax=Streptomyces TaxID=1883 RepID=UPI000C2786A2|nr:hypothetical protein [Streptomyces sp. CB01201]MBX7467684.1 hypothetical protein [Streptomyces sp. MAG02]PJN02189.1 hypothetical protein CG740_14090 [Streptomyces sp. CB01201]